MKETWIVYKKLFRYIRLYWLNFVIAIFSNLIYGGLSAFFTYLIKPILDKGFIDRDPEFIHWLPVIIVFVFLLRGVADMVSSYSMAAVARGVIMRLRQALFRHYQKMPADFYDHHHSGQLLSTITYNVDQISNASANAITMFIQSFGMIVGLLIVMFVISWQLTLIYFIALPIIVYVVYLNSQKTRKISKSIQASMASVVSAAQENIDGYRVVRAFGSERHESEKFDCLTQVNRRREMKNVLTKSFGDIYVQMIAAVVLAITVYLASSGHTSEVLSAGDFMSLIAAMLAILKPMKDLTNVNNVIQRGVAGAESIFSALEEPVEIDLGNKSLSHAQGAVSFDSVTFTYSAAKTPALKNISFSVKPGMVVALVGHSGSGKSTLVSLLGRFYQDYSGVIQLDGVNIQEYCLKDFRKQFAMVSQDVVLFDESVANNISYGDFNEPEREAVIRAAKLAHADEFIQRLPNGYDTLVGQDGVLLSGGQRQRLAIARAIYKNAPILILDEATSALDSESERAIQAGFEVLMKNRTTFVIAHRLSTIEHADKIVVMQNGELVEVGSHNELLQREGVYTKLYRSQFRDPPA